jgi:hypothetical protein
VSGSTEAQRVQDAIHATLRQVADLEEIVGVDIRGISLTTTPLAIVHGLGRAPIGWRLIDKTGAGDPYRTAWDDRTISIRVASGTLTCSIRVW